MKISICITYYNQEQFVRQSLDSVLSIDFPCDFEILCGDDGSSDGTQNVIKEYCEKYPNNLNYFVMIRGKSAKSINRASSNRLNLASKATGDYILFLDGDDFYCDKNFVKDAIKILKKSDQLIGCAFNFKFLCSNGYESVFVQSMKESLVKASCYISDGKYTPSGAIVFKNVLTRDRIAFLKSINIFDDNAITIYMMQFGDLYYIDRPVYVYRQTDSSIWNSFSDAEKNVCNAMDYKSIARYVPIFDAALVKRQYSAMRYLYKNKNYIKQMLGKKHKKYLLMADRNCDYFIYNLLAWESLNWIKKMQTKFNWIKYKVKARLL